MKLQLSLHILCQLLLISPHYYLHGPFHRKDEPVREQTAPTDDEGLLTVTVFHPAE